MIVPKQNFLFFLCDYKGRAYYLGKNGNVQTGNLSSGEDYSLPESPSGWLDQELSWSRNQKYYGFFRSYSPDLKFTKTSAKIIRKLYYLGKGIEQQVYFIATKWNPTSGVYELYYKAELDFTQITEDNPVEGITIKTMEGGILKIFKAYENTIFEIPCDGSIPQNKSVLIDGIVFKSLFNYEFTPFAIKVRGTVIPLIFSTEQGNDVGIAKGDQNYYGFDPTDSGSIAAMLATGNYCFSSNYEIKKTINLGITTGGVTIAGSISISGSMTSGRLFILLSDDAANSIEIIPAQIMGAGTLSFSETFDVNAGSQVYLCFECIGNNGGGVSQGKFSLTFDSKFEDTYTYVMKPSDVLNLLMQKICVNASEVGHNISYVAQSSLLQQFNNLVLTSGGALRNNTKAVIKISLAMLWDIYNPILNAVLGTQITDQGEILFFEGKETVFNSTNIDVELGEVARLKITPAVNMFFDKLKIGYMEQKYDNKQGNDEFNTTAQYRTPIKKLSKDFDLVCKGRADSFGIEYTRFLTGTTNTSNNKSDNDIFIINVDFSSNTNTEVIILGDTSSSTVTALTYRGTGYGIESSTILNFPISYLSIQGNSFKNNFSLVSSMFFPYDIISPNSKVQFDNTQAGFTAIHGTVSFNFKVDGLLIKTPTSGDKAHTTKIKSGVFRIRFSLTKNGKPVASNYVTLALGSTFCLVQFDFNTHLYFGQQFWMDWELDDYDKSDVDGRIYYRFYIINGVYYRCSAPQGAYYEVLSSGVTGKFSVLKMTFSSANPQPIYSLQRVTYDKSATGMTNPDSAYNIEDLTPGRMVIRHGNWLRSILFQMIDKNLTFQTSDKNHLLSTTLNGATITEGTDIPIELLNDNILFYPFIFEFETKIPVTFLELMNSARNAHIHFTFYGVDFYGFPMEVKVKPALNESQSWKMLASPKNELLNFSDLNLSGINLLNLQKMSTFISHLNPVKFVPLGLTKDPKYNFLHMDEDWFINQIKFWTQSRDYYQKWQKNDTISLQVISNSIGPAKIDVYLVGKSIGKQLTALFNFDFDTLTNIGFYKSNVNCAVISENGQLKVTIVSGFVQIYSLISNYIGPETLNAGIYKVTINFISTTFGTALFRVGDSNYYLTPGINTINFTIDTPQIFLLQCSYYSGTSVFIFDDWKCETVESVVIENSLIDSIVMTQVSDSAIIAPLILYQSNINLSTFNAGIYYFVLSIGVGEVVDQFISEGISIKDNWPVTLLFEYKNSVNKLSTIFSSGFTPSFRVEGWLDDYQAKSHTAAFEDQPGDMKILNTIPFNTHKLNIGKDYGLPPYILRLVNMIMGLDDVSIDDLAFTKAAEDSEWEKTHVAGWPLEYFTIEIREAQNEQGVSVITEGSIEEKLVVTYQVNQKGFGELPEGDNIVPIKKVE